MQRATKTGLFARLRHLLSSPSGIGVCDLDQGLDRIAHRLGLEGQPAENFERNSHRAEVDVIRSRDVSRSIYYAPDMDGQADPGEVVWVWVPDETTGSAQERALVVVGRTRQHILGLLISPNSQHATESTWLDIGSGAWDTSGKNCWVRLDKVVRVAEDAIRRQGAIMPRRRFDRIAHRLRNEFSWT
ncbi:type II toxin-antitoxin system PemK/MazF family toxin [Corynebacterium aquilae]|uniref:Growth inhibitor PemK n=1 Tax=Corynebacterium aquilae DSM 44791 TaxID=1431546 RepID=A0A1L7CH89_9CORY|nr:hypothetical protein CAQU_09265 [Corynebacterium aquilae DSM 44791]